MKINTKMTLVAIAITCFFLTPHHIVHGQNSEKESLAWEMEHAQKGDPLAQCRLGVRYVLGRGVEQSLEEARKWYSKAANQGEAEGQILLGTMYYDGSGIGKDYSKAYEWFNKAAAQGNAEAMGRVGMMHANGLGVATNIPLAIEWFEKSGKAGSPNSQAEMGKRYLSGLGVPEDHVKAYAWFSLAARTHAQSEEINKMLSLIRPTLSTEQISEAELMVNQWQSGESKQGQQGAPADADKARWGVANAQTKGNVYSNKFVGLSFSVPEGWYIATDNETKDLMPDAARVIGLDDPSAKSVVAQMPGIVLLMVSERPFSSDVQSANRNIIFVAINAREMKNEVRSGADYLGHVARGMRESQPSATVSDIITQRLGGEEFHRMNVRLPMQGITVHMSQLARIHNDYIVILNMSADSDNGLTELIEIAANNMRLSAVPQAVDSSPEGTSFRKKSSLNISGSSGSSTSGGNLLKNIGIILMILGAIWFIKSLFGRK